MLIKFQVPIHITWSSGDWQEEEKDLPPTLSLLEYVVDDLNASELEQYSDGLVRSYKAYFTNDYKLWIEFNTSRPKAALAWWFGQFSDGWGEGFEQQDVPADSFYRGRDGDLYISTWDGEDSQNWPYEVLDKRLD